MNELENSIYDSLINYARSEPTASAYTAGAFDDPRLLCKYSLSWISYSGVDRVRAVIDLSVTGDNNLEYYPLDVFIEPQCMAGGYTLDFCLSSSMPDVSLGVEIDGHEWHEMNKEQAAADKRRGRDLLTDDICTIRFTGSEAYTNPNRVADECFKIFMSMVYHRVEKHLSFYSQYAVYLKENK